MRSIRTTAAVIAPLVVAASVAASVPAFGKDAVVTNSGACSGTSTSKIKAAPDNSSLQVEFEVDSNVVGQTWQWVLFDNGSRVAAGHSQTVAPSGSFEVRRLIANQPGTDQIRGRAKNPATGEICRFGLNI